MANRIALPSHDEKAADLYGSAGLCGKRVLRVGLQCGEIRDEVGTISGEFLEVGEKGRHAVAAICGPCGEIGGQFRRGIGVGLGGGDDSVSVSDQCAISGLAGGDAGVETGDEIVLKLDAIREELGFVGGDGGGIALIFEELDDFLVDDGFVNEGVRAFRKAVFKKGGAHGGDVGFHLLEQRREGGGLLGVIGLDMGDIRKKFAGKGETVGFEGEQVGVNLEAVCFDGGAEEHRHGGRGQEGPRFHFFHDAAIFARSVCTHDRFLSWLSAGRIIRPPPLLAIRAVCGIVAEKCPGNRDNS